MLSSTKGKTNSSADHKFIQHLLSLSNEKELPGALTEWKLLAKEARSYEKKKAQCICEKKIKHAYFVYNKNTGKTITVGSTCCKNFDISFQSETKPNLFFMNVERWIGENGYEAIDDIEKYAEKVKTSLHKDCYEKYLTCKNSISQLKMLRKELEELTSIKGVYYLTDILELIDAGIASILKADEEKKIKAELLRQEWDKFREVREAKQRYKEQKEREELECKYQKEREKKERKEQKEKEELRLEIEEEKRKKKEMNAKKEVENKARKLKYLELEKKQELEDAPQLAAFGASLSPKDQIIHDLAAKMLKTRYDPKRTNAYLKWVATVESTTR